MIELPTLTELSADLVAQEQATATALVQELNPTLDLRRGVQHDIVMHCHAILAAAARTNLNRYLSARSLQDIQADPTLADDDVVDRVLSNWGLTRQNGGKAAGEVVIQRTTNDPVTLSAGTVFVANGRQYVTPQLFSATANPDLVRDQYDRLITQVAADRYAFTIAVEAVENGTDYVITKDTVILPVASLAGLVTAYAASDFTGGQNSETNEELVRRLSVGVAAKGAANRLNMAAMLHAVPAFSRIQDMSIIGFGDPEMLRDRHSLLPISYGGRVDWYIRSQGRAEHRLLTKDAVLVAKQGREGVWQLSLDRNDAPGFYELRNIRRPDSTGLLRGYAVQQDTRGVDLTGSGFRPDIATAEEGAFTAFQTAVVQFLDTDTDVQSLEIGDSQPYEIEAVLLPLIAELQTYVSQRDVRLGDTLIKAPVPCFVQVHCTIYRKADIPDPDLPAIQAAVADAINGTGFIGRLYSSQLTDVICSYLPNTMRLGAVDMLGRLRYPSEVQAYLRDGIVLQVPELPGQLVTANTVQFLAEPSDIVISVETGIPTSL